MKTLAPCDSATSMQLLETPEIAIHRVNAFDHDELTFPFCRPNDAVQRSGIVMLEFLRPAAGERRAVAQTEMRAVVEHRHVGFPQQSGDRPERAAESAVEKHGVFAAEELRRAALQLAMEIGHAREHGRTAGAQA